MIIHYDFFFYTRSIGRLNILVYYRRIINLCWNWNLHILIFIFILEEVRHPIPPHFHLENLKLMKIQIHTVILSLLYIAHRKLSQGPYQPPPTLTF